MNRVLYVAQKEFAKLAPLCDAISYAGSIRRKVPNPTDVDFVLVPKNLRDFMEFIFLSNERIETFGQHQISYKRNGIKIDLFIATRDDWGGQLHWRTGPKGHNIGFCCIAKKLGYTLNEHGLWRNGCYIAGRTEEGIYRMLGKPWKAPELRGL